jgi:hypothetical protein
MKKCTSCSADLKEDDIFCGACGEEQNLFVEKVLPQKVSSTSKDFITVLCILTLVGSFFGMFRGLFYQFVADAANNDTYYRGLIFFVLNVGTAAGAIMMLNRSKIGLYIFTGFQILYLIMVMVTSLVYFGEEDESVFAFMLAMIFFLPSLAFLILYWLPQNKLALK